MIDINDKLEKFIDNNMDLVNEFYEKTGIEFDKFEIPTQIISIVKSSTNNFLDFISKWASDFLTGILQGSPPVPFLRE